VIGVVAGDGYATQLTNKYNGYNEVIIGVKVKDREFAEEFARCIGIVLGRKPPKIRLKNDGRFVAEAKSKTLYELLKKPINIDKIRQYIEHDIRCIGAFLRGFFDSEGGVHGNGSIRVYNSDKSLLEYTNELLNRLGIKTTGPKLSSKAGTPINDLKKGKIYFTRKDVYYLYICAEDRLRFYELIGFTIKRKQQYLEECLISLGFLKKERRCSDVSDIASSHHSLFSSLFDLSPDYCLIFMEGLSPCFYSFLMFKAWFSVLLLYCWMCLGLLGLLWLLFSMLSFLGILVRVRKIARAISPFVSRSYNAVWRWEKRLKG